MGADKVADLITGELDLHLADGVVLNRGISAQSKTLSDSSIIIQDKLIIHGPYLSETVGKRQVLG